AACRDWPPSTGSAMILSEGELVGWFSWAGEPASCDLAGRCPACGGATARKLPSGSATSGDVKMRSGPVTCARLAGNAEMASTQTAPHPNAASSGSQRFLGGATYV